MEKPKLSIISIINMSIGFMGIQFGWGLQMANMSAIYTYLGANPDSIPILWLAAPLTGLIIQPIIGHLSDNTWCKLGRRRPYFLIGSILAMIALFGMPYSGCLIMAAGFLWVLDASVNISMEPFRAFVADMLPEDQRTLGYSVQTLFVSIGAAVASAFPYILDHVFNIKQAEAGTVHKVSSFSLFADRLPSVIKISFNVGAVVLIVCVLWTIFTVKEYPPENVEKFKAAKKKDRNIGKFFAEIVFDIIHMPKMMRKLAWVQFFTWIGLFLMWLYFVITVGELFGPKGSPEYLQGIEWGGLCFAAYNIFSLIYSFFMPVIAKKITRKWTHIISLLFGSVCMMAVLIPSQGGDISTLKIFVMLLTVGIGIAWGSILTMPYALLSTSIPEDKMGFYMGVFNFFITIPQIISAVGFGWVMLHVFNNASQWGVACGGITWVLAAVMMLRIKEKRA